MLREIGFSNPRILAVFEHVLYKLVLSSSSPNCRSVVHSERSALLYKPSSELFNGGLMFHPIQNQLVQTSRLSKLFEEWLDLTVGSAKD